MRRPNIRAFELLRLSRQRIEASVGGYFVSHVLEDANRVRREAHLLQLDLIGQPLIMEARRIHRLLNVQSVIHHAHQHIGDGSDDRGAALSAENQEELAAFEHDGRRHGGQRPLAGANCICGTLDQSEDVGHAWLG